MSSTRTATIENKTDTLPSKVPAQLALRPLSFFVYLSGFNTTYIQVFALYPQLAPTHQHYDAIANILNLVYGSEGAYELFTPFSVLILIISTVFFCLRRFSFRWRMASNRMISRLLMLSSSSTLCPFQRGHFNFTERGLCVLYANKNGIPVPEGNYCSVRIRNVQRMPIEIDMI
jgi:hypothetical protein